MLTDKQIHSIQTERSRTTFPKAFIHKTDRDWDEIQEIFKGCTVDLSKIPIIPVKTEYRKWS